MSRDSRWRRIEELYHAALEHAESERPAFLESSCAGDVSLRQEVESLLAETATDDFLTSPALEAAGRELAASREILLGRRLGAYHVVSLLGSGGMGEVYRARDTKLGREVAIKVLSALFTSDPDRLARFEREARVLAALNHPNVATIHGIEPIDGGHALILEVVEGETLEDRIATRRRLPLTEALEIARQIAIALEAAHDAGIVHRDLKPANIKIRPDGVVKVLDFGLAKAAPTGSVDRDRSATMGAGHTHEGIVLGTAAYMSPEQAEGRPVDGRTDIWSFGVIVYEMLSGHRAFTGGTAVDTLSNVLKAEPDWTALPPDIPAQLRSLLRRCVQKDPTRRLRHITDARFQLEDALADRDAPAGVDARLAVEGAFDAGRPRHPRTGPSARWRKAPTAAAAFLGGAVIAAISAWSVLNDTTVREVTRYLHEVAAGQPLPTNSENQVTVAPDGSAFAYHTLAGIYLRRKDELDAVLIEGTDGESLFPVFSPDGQWIGYWSRNDQRIKRIALTGGVPVVVAAVGTRLFGLSWARDDTFLYGHADGISRVSATRGAPELIVVADRGEVLDGPQLLPDGHSILFSATTGAGNVRWDEGKVVVFSPSSGRRTVVLERGSDARYLPTGHLIYAENNALLAVPFDVESLRILGAAFPVVTEVERNTNPGDGGASANYALGQDGTLVYLSDGPTDARRLVWVDREGNAQRIPMEPGRYISVRISPQGTRAVVEDRDSARGLWIWNFERNIRTRLSVGLAGGDVPTWSLDGARVAYDNNVGGLSWILADNTAPPERLPETPRREPDPYFFARVPDGTALVFKDDAGPTTGWDIAMMLLDRNGEFRRLVNDPRDQRAATLSRDGKWIAYESNEEGSFEIYIRPFPNVADKKIQVTANGGVHALWSRDGRELFYVEPGDNPGLMSVRTDIRTADVVIGTPVRLFDWPYITTNIRGYDVAPDGTRFLAITPHTGTPSTRPRIVVIENFFSELQRLAPKK